MITVPDIDKDMVGKYLTCADAAKELGLSEDTVRRYCNSEPPRIYAEKIGRDWLISPREIELYKRNRRDVGRPPTR